MSLHKHGSSHNETEKISDILRRVRAKQTKKRKARGRGEATSSELQSIAASLRKSIAAIDRELATPVPGLKKKSK